RPPPGRRPRLVAALPPACGFGPWPGEPADRRRDRRHLLPVPGPRGAAGDRLDRERAVLSVPALEPRGPGPAPVAVSARAGLRDRVVPGRGGVRRRRRGRPGHDPRPRYGRSAPRAPARGEGAAGDRLLVAGGLGGGGGPVRAGLGLAHRGIRGGPDVTGSD